MKEATTSIDYKVATKLFKEYASQLEIDLAFQSFNKEVENIERQYSRPKGTIFITYNEDKLPLGCFGIRELEGLICELKRMYVKKEARGLGIGKKMLIKSLEVGKELGYKKMRLDTLSTMLSAIALYKKMGFYEIKPYRYNPIKGAKFFEVELNK
ncbi:MAG: GNAT family N-acetyltransferase [Bacteroidota bacterium]